MGNDLHAGLSNQMAVWNPVSTYLLHESGPDLCHICDLHQVNEAMLSHLSRSCKQKTAFPTTIKLFRTWRWANQSNGIDILA